MINQSATKPSAINQLLQLPVLVFALGYLVDMYDLFLFSVVRVPSLKALGVESDRLLSEGIFLLNFQMAGILIGGIFWDILGDKRGLAGVRQSTWPQRTCYRGKSRYADNFRTSRG